MELPCVLLLLLLLIIWRALVTVIVYYRLTKVDVIYFAERQCRRICEWDIIKKTLQVHLSSVQSYSSLPPATEDVLATMGHHHHYLGLYQCLTIKYTSQRNWWQGSAGGQVEGVQSKRSRSADKRSWFGLVVGARAIKSTVSSSAGRKMYLCWGQV